jgi:hypothetical protein
MPSISKKIFGWISIFIVIGIMGSLLWFNFPIVDEVNQASGKSGNVGNPMEISVADSVGKDHDEGF